MKKALFTALALLSLTTASLAQINYPFTDTTGNRDIQAYWYNIPPDSISDKFLFGKMYFHSFLQVYGKAPGDTFQIREEIYLKNGTKVLDNVVEVTAGELVEKPVAETDAGKDQSLKPPYRNFNVTDGFFRLEHQVAYLKENPAKIVISIVYASGRRSREIECRYHKLYGKITDFDGKPFRAFVGIGSEAFFGEKSTVWSDSSGSYQVELPERTYNSIAVDDESYTIKTTETWAWHIILDCDQRLDFKVGTGEVYNLNVWPNNGGGNSYFVSFRPMVLVPRELWNQKYADTLNGREFTVIGLAPELDIKDIRVSVNGSPVEIISLQKYLETGKAGSAMLAYLIQVNTRGLNRNGKQTVTVEYEKVMEIGGEKVLRRSQGYFQFMPNHSGLSSYY